jgi:hypothetical protein
MKDEEDAMPQIENKEPQGFLDIDDSEVQSWVWVFHFLQDFLEEVEK